MRNSQDDVKPTTTTLQQLLPRFLDQIQTQFLQKSHDILQSWKEVIEPEFLRFTEASSFEKGVLYVKVKNSTVLSLINGTTHKQKILQTFRNKFPNIEIRNIHFRIG